MTVELAPTRTGVQPTMSPESRDVLIRIVEYALVEANREGEATCAIHLQRALDELLRMSSLHEREWLSDPASASKPRLVS